MKSGEALHTRTDETVANHTPLRLLWRALKPEWATAIAGYSLGVPWLVEASYAFDALTAGRLYDSSTEPGVFTCLLLFVLSCALVLGGLSVTQLHHAPVSWEFANGTCVGLTVLGSALYFLEPAAGEASETLGMIRSLCLGAATGWCIGFWSNAFSAWDNKRIAIGVLATATLTCMLFNIATWLSAHVVGVLSCICTACSMALGFWNIKKTSSPPGSNQPNVSPAIGSPLFKRSVGTWNARITVLTGLIGFAFGAMLYIFITTSGRGTLPLDTWWMPLAGIPVICAALVVGWLRTHELDFLRSLRIICIVAIPAFFPLRVGSYALQFAFNFTVVALVAILSVLAMALASSEHALNRVGATSGSLGPLGLATGISLGMLFAFFCVCHGPIGEDMVYFTGLISLVCIFVGANVLTSTDGLAAIERIAANRFPMHIDTALRLAGTGGNSDTGAALTRACKELALEKCLTDRETEVLIILARGNSLTRVQEDLLISEGTAITHRNHIYRKLGVHSKQELIDVIDRRTEA